MNFLAIQPVLKFLCLAFFIAGLFVCGAHRVAANDTEVSIAAGGIQMTKDARISMEKERLTIGRDKVAVEYEFLNESDADITAQVAFPVKHFCFEGECGPPTFANFRVWIEGVEVKYAVKATATINGKDYTSVLEGLGVDVRSYGHWHFLADDNAANYDVFRLPEADRKKLISLGLIDRSDLSPQWLVQEIYHWNQTFPSKAILHVRHEYRPATGYQAYLPVELPQAHSDACIDPSLNRKLLADNQAFRANRKFGPNGDESVDDYVQASWVDYILTTANNWKTPIKDFTLIVEKPVKDANSRYPWYVSFCWDGTVQKINERQYMAHKQNFIPQNELRIFFLTLMNQ